MLVGLLKLLLLRLNNFHGLIILDDGTHPLGQTPSGLRDLGEHLILVVRVVDKWLKDFNQRRSNVVLFVILTLLEEFGSEKLLLGGLQVIKLCIFASLSLDLFSWYGEHKTESLDDQ